MCKTEPWTERFWAVQYVDELQDIHHAEEVLDLCTAQSDFIAGRICPPNDIIPTWLVQVLFEDCGIENANALPDGCRRVLVLPSMYRMFNPIGRNP